MMTMDGLPESITTLSDRDVLLVVNQILARPHFDFKCILAIASEMRRRHLDVTEHHLLKLAATKAIQE
jgi:hypothetical protein